MRLRMKLKSSGGGFSRNETGGHSKYFSHFFCVFCLFVSVYVCLLTDGRGLILSKVLAVFKFWGKDIEKFFLHFVILTCALFCFGHPVACGGQSNTQPATTITVVHSNRKEKD
jgi:hypothetical protein